MFDENPYYTHPVQCAFWDGEKWNSGIVFKDNIINGTTGEALSTTECVAAAKNVHLDDWIVEYEWFDLNRHFLKEGMKVLGEEE